MDEVKQLLECGGMSVHFIFRVVAVVFGKGSVK